ncbi:SPASM domain-containing protein [Natranaerobius thermophilus]
MNLREELKNGNIYENEKGKVFLRELNVASLGDAEKLDDDILENRKGKGLFDIECPHFIPREKAYDGGKHHGDLFIDCDGIVYTCGNHAFPVGDVYEESLASIIDGINNPRPDGRFGLTRKVYNSLLVLSRYMVIENMAIGKVFQMIYQENPKLITNIQTQCGACSRLGYNEDFKKHF